MIRSVLILIMNLLGLAATAWWAVLDLTPFNVLCNLIWIAAAVMAGCSCVSSWRTVRLRREIRWMENEMCRIRREMQRESDRQWAERHLGR